MNCPKCHGKGRVVVYDEDYDLGITRTAQRPCDHPGCHAGQVSCAEGENRDEAAVVA